MDETLNGRLRSAIECLLFVSGKALTVQRMSEVLKLDKAAVEHAIQGLMEDYTTRIGGLQIVEVAGGYKMCTRSEFSDVVESLRENMVRPRRLSAAALETLAIISYKQPLSRVEIEEIRGVDVGGVLATLMEYGLVRIAGRRRVAGKPLLYGTTPDFLEWFGLSSLKDLPRAEDLAVGRHYDLFSSTAEAQEGRESQE